MSPLPIERPGKVIAVGLNYRAHAAETGQELPTAPMLFAKWQTCLIGNGEPIVLPTISDKVDFEAELGVVIGRVARNVGVDDALDVVAGYLCANDVSARDLQRSDKQYSRAKSLDTFGPIGPRFVPAAEIPDPQSLRIRSLLNGRVMQDSNTSDMVFSVRELIAFIAAGITLEPGDLIVTGTPEGVGFAREPQVFLQPGDTITVEIEGLGELTNPVVAAPSR